MIQHDTESVHSQTVIVIEVLRLMLDDSLVQLDVTLQYWSNHLSFGDIVLLDQIKQQNIVNK